MWKVVIIDDDFQVVRGLRKVIPWAELDAEFAGEAIDGEAGLKLIAEVNPDIVLTDIYMPVMNGIQMIEQLKAGGFAGRFVILSGYNDFEYARTALRLGVDDYLTKPVTVEQIRSVLSETIEKLEETYLQRLELGSAPSPERREALCLEEWLAGELNGWGQSSAVSVPPELLRERKFTVLIMEVLWTERIRSISLADWSLFKFAVSNIASEVFSREWPEFCFVWLFGNHAALLLPSPVHQAEAEIVQAAGRLGELMVGSMKTYLGLEVRFGTGEVKSGWSGIKASGEEAMQRMFAKQPQQGPSGDGDTAGEASGSGPAERAGEMPLLTDYYQSMTKALREDRDDEVMQLIRLYLQHRQPAQPDPVSFRMLAAEVWTMLHNIMLMAGLPGRSDEEGLALRELSELTELPKIEDWLETQIRSLRRAQAPAIQEKHRKAVQFMTEYIHKHYAEDITLEVLASQLYISKNYLNQLFKKVTGETFTNYVIRVRIEKAKALLLEGNHLIYEVSEMVGYQNVPYFSTLFKKYCGVSPSELIKR
ncbi:response regulator transcription factor [Paenibacillus sp. MMS20-IR301]|uniref:response regulator transcription factor n=1 Tax=Paenibacillus sp. MMS20-IR301 TaxID=2895946 RepID=UPI0028E4A9D3|nr:response regulator transcription factor [Paenibacillus sp. MMS20-IR301]WNS43713.1 response regulator transcription factor [Paenibacillus sp. MMS20-IR301]